jgi:beta-carotene 3-hydroxylase
MLIVSVLTDIALVLAAFAGMEVVAWWTHRYVMHGWLWSLHRSHHELREGVFELNDLFAVFFSLPSMALIYAGTWYWRPALYLGIGMTCYGAAYALFHDALVHRRFPSPIPLRLMKTQVQAHRLHHAVATKYGCVSFGFLWAQPVRRLKAELAAIQGRSLAAPRHDQQGDQAAGHAPVHQGGHHEGRLAIAAGRDLEHAPQE